jgi:hypothetical protein
MVRTLLALLMALSASASMAEIEKIAITGDRGMEFYWWPKLPPVEGWGQDRGFSFRYSVNALAPVGQSFADAETVMYAKAVYKPRELEVKSLQMLVENDKQEFIASVPGVQINEAPALTTADGQKLISLMFAPRGEGNWERVSYVEEGDFYLIFTVSSRSARGLASAGKAYEALVSNYREKP